MAEAQCNWIVMDYAEKGVKILKFCLGIDMTKKKKKKIELSRKIFLSNVWKNTINSRLVTVITQYGAIIFWQGEHNEKAK